MPFCVSEGLLKHFSFFHIRTHVVQKCVSSSVLFELAIHAKDEICMCGFLKYIEMDFISPGPARRLLFLHPVGSVIDACCIQRHCFRQVLCLTGYSHC